MNVWLSRLSQFRRLKIEKLGYEINERKGPFRGEKWLLFLSVGSTVCASNNSRVFLKIVSSNFFFSSGKVQVYLCQRLLIGNFEVL